MRVSNSDKVLSFLMPSSVCMEHNGLLWGARFFASLPADGRIKGGLLHIAFDNAYHQQMLVLASRDNIHPDVEYL